MSRWHKQGFGIITGWKGISFSALQGTAEHSAEHYDKGLHIGVDPYHS